MSSREIRCCFSFPNDYRLVECRFGTLQIGAVAVPLNIKMAADTLRYVATHSDAQVLIGHAELINQITDLRAITPTLKYVLIAGGDATGAESYDQRLAETTPSSAAVAVAAKDPAFLMYTSGSTGRPKGCLLSHESGWWQARSCVRTMLLDEHDRGLVTGPLYHTNALWACLLPMLFGGGSMVILPGFHPNAVLAAMDRYQPTYTSGTPSMFSLLLAQHDALTRSDLSSLELLVYGSAPVPEELLAALNRQFGCEVVEG